MTSVLFCGGPANGKWLDLNPGTSEYEIVAPPTPLEFANGTGTLSKVRYRIWPIRFLGYQLLVAAPESDHNESDSVLYAVLQRDVADHLRGKGRR